VSCSKAELIPQKITFYSICELGRRFKAGDFGGGEKGVCQKTPSFIAE
jgi:hypothetical protein